MERDTLGRLRRIPKRSGLTTITATVYCLQLLKYGCSERQSALIRDTKTHVSVFCRVPLCLTSGALIMENTRARGLIADDHKLIAGACKTLLQPEFDVVGTVTNARDLIEAASELRPDIVILDISMPQLNGLDAGEQLK